MRKILPKRRTKRDATPRIVYLVGALAYLFWAGWAFTLFKLPPDSSPYRLLFLGTLFLALFSTFLFFFYEGGKILTRRSPAVLFYPATRRSFFVAAFFTLAAGMKLVGISNLVNVSLFGLILLLVEIQLSRV